MKTHGKTHRFFCVRPPLKMPGVPAQYDDLSPEEITQEVAAGRLLTAEQARDRVLAWGSRFYTALTQLPPDVHLMRPNPL